MLARTEQDRPDRQMQIVDQPRLKILPDGRDTATDANVARARCGPGLVQRRMNAAGDEPKLRAAGHLERRPRVMG